MTDQPDIAALAATLRAKAEEWQAHGATVMHVRPADVIALCDAVAVLKSAHGSNARVRRRMRRAGKFDAEKAASALGQKLFERKQEADTLRIELAGARETIEAMKLDMAEVPTLRARLAEAEKERDEARRELSLLVEGGAP